MKFSTKHFFCILTGGKFQQTPYLNWKFHLFIVLFKFSNKQQLIIHDVLYRFVSVCSDVYIICIYFVLAIKLISPFFLFVLFTVYFILIYILIYKQEHSLRFFSAFLDFLFKNELLKSSVFQDDYELEKHIFSQSS